MSFDLPSDFVEALAERGFTEFEDLGHGQGQFYPATEPYEEDYMVHIEEWAYGPSDPVEGLDRYRISLINAQSGETVDGWRGQRTRTLSDWKNFVKDLKVEGIEAGVSC